MDALSCFTHPETTRKCSLPIGPAWPKEIPRLRNMRSGAGRMARLRGVFVRCGVLPHQNLRYHTLCARINLETL